jgi:hypothetical protein
MQGLQMKKQQVNDKQPILTNTLPLSITKNFIISTNFPGELNEVE